MAEAKRSGVGPAGVRSGRRYTAAEVAAARRCGLINGKESMDALSGPMFWATGNAYPDEIRQKAADYALLAEAVKREWGRIRTEGDTNTTNHEEEL